MLVNGILLAKKYFISLNGWKEILLEINISNIQKVMKIAYRFMYMMHLKKEKTNQRFFAGTEWFLKSNRNKWWSATEVILAED